MQTAEMEHNAAHLWWERELGVVNSLDYFGRWNIVRETNPLKNDVVLDTLFSFLSGEELMNCRLVNKKWLSLSEKYFKQECRLTLAVKNVEMETSASKLASLNEVFPLSDVNPSGSFNAVAFKGKIESQVLTEFFNSPKGKLVNDVLFYNMRVFDDEGLQQSYCIDPLLRSINLKHLRIKREEYNYDEYYDDNNRPTDLWMKSSSLRSCNTVDLTQCALICDAKISPSRFNVQGSLLTKHNGIQYAQLPYLNSLIDFGKAKYVYPSMLCKTKIDMRDKRVIMEELELDDNQMVHWESAAWQIEDLTLHRSHFVRKSQLKVRYFMIDDWAVLDLAAIPNTVEMLDIGASLSKSSDPPFLRKAKLKVSEPLPTFSHLRFLKLCDRLDHLHYFSNCEHLVDLVLHGAVKTKKKWKLNVNSIPKNLECLSLDCIEFSDDVGVRDLHTLVLRYFPVNNVRQALERFRPVSLVLDHPFPEWEYKSKSKHQNEPQHQNQRMSSDEWKTFFDSTRGISKEQWKEFLQLTKSIGISFVLVGPLDNFSLLTGTVYKLKKGKIGDYCIFSNDDGKVRYIEYCQFRQFKEFRSPFRKNFSYHELMNS